MSETSHITYGQNKHLEYFPLYLQSKHKSNYCFMFILSGFITFFHSHTCFISTDNFLFLITFLALLVSYSVFLLPVPKIFPSSGMCWCNTPSVAFFRSLYVVCEDLILLTILLQLLLNKTLHFYTVVLSEVENNYSAVFGPAIPV